MKGWMKITAKPQAEVDAVQKTLLEDPERKGSAVGFQVDAELEQVGAFERLALVSAVGSALKFDQEDWTMLFMMKMGIGPLGERQVSVDTAHGLLKEE